TCLPQAGFRCNADVRSHEASDGQGEDQSWLLARKPARVETSSRARHPGPAGGSNDCRHYARHPASSVMNMRRLTDWLLSNPNGLCVPKIRFCNIGDEGRRGQAVM